jgi:hypothetical protein
MCDKVFLVEADSDDYDIPPHFISVNKTLEGAKQSALNFCKTVIHTGTVGNWVQSDTLYRAYRIFDLDGRSRTQRPSRSWINIWETTVEE